MSSQGDELLHTHWPLPRQHLLVERLSVLASAVFSYLMKLDWDGALISAANDQRSSLDIKAHVWLGP